MKPILLAAALGLAATTGVAADTYTIDTTHAQIVFSYNHLGFSTTFGMFSDITGTIEFDAQAPAASSVEASFPVGSLASGDDERDAHLLGADFFGAEAAPTVTFVSTGIEVTGDSTALITGDLTLNGVTQPVVLDTQMTKMDVNPLTSKPWVGFFATATVSRSAFDMGQYVPFISDEVAVQIAFEAMKAE